MFGDLKYGFRSLATLKLVVTVVGEGRTLNRKEQLRHRAGFLATARFSCFKKSAKAFQAEGPA